MKTSDLGLVFEDKLSKTPWAQISLSDGKPTALWFGTVATLLGKMTVIGEGDSLCYLGFEEKRSIEKCAHFFKTAEFVRDDKQAERMGKKIIALWNGKSSKPLAVILNGTPFQKKVWSSLMKIQAGHAVSYGTIAKSIGSPAAVRAVGTAVGANPISLLIPCHRVVQQSGKVENYGWGDAMKQKLLKEEVLQKSHNNL
jgi:AraC family transcriptional regulator of adaptative response/methylated-DNA-[protein]-cysteine methyltransferase